MKTRNTNRNSGQGSNRQKKGGWRYIDDWTGFYSWSDRGKLEWDGLRTDDPDKRNPQDFVGGVPDLQTVPWTRPEPPDAWLTFCLFTSLGVPLLTSTGSPLLAAAA